MIVLLLCSGGSYWYRRRRFNLSQDQFGNTTVYNAAGVPIAVCMRGSSMAAPVNVQVPTTSTVIPANDAPPKYDDVVRTESNANPAPPSYDAATAPTRSSNTSIFNIFRRNNSPNT